MKSGRVFQARGPATASARSPSVIRRVSGTSRADEDVFDVWGVTLYTPGCEVTGYLAATAGI